MLSASLVTLIHYPEECLYVCDADGALCSTVPIVAASCFVTAQKGKLRERERRDKTATAEQMVINCILQAQVLLPRGEPNIGLH